MPIAKVQLPDGRIAKFEVPEGTTPEQVTAFAESNFSQQNQAPQSNGLSWRDVPQKAYENALPSLVNVGKGIAETVLNPVDTLQNVVNAGNAGLQAVLPQSVNDFMHRIAPETANNPHFGAAIADFYKNRYGSEEGFKQALATDPAGVLMDFSSIASAGGGLMSKAGIPGASSLSKAGQAIDPVNLAVKGITSGAKGLGTASAHIIGGLGTHTGAESILGAANAGLSGGSKGADFLDNLRGNVQADEMLPSLKKALRNMRDERGAEYRQGMSGIRQDQTVLSMGNIKQAIDDAMGIKRFKGESISPTTDALQGEILAQYDRWNNLNPADFHTAEGLDAFKQNIGDLHQGTMPNTPNRAVAGQVYNAIKDEIVKQAPEYGKIMADYEQATKLTNDIEGALSLGSKANPDTAIRKLQSLTRNNVNTNYGNRLKLAKELERNGADNLTEKLSGQALSSWTPRGLGSLIAAGTGYYGVSSLDPLAAAGLAFQSPRLVGEGAYKAGQLANILKKGSDTVKAASNSIGINPKVLANVLYQPSNLQQ